MFKITDEMKKRCLENKHWLEWDLENKRTYWIAFCDKFYRDIKWNFDTRWNFDWDTYLMYVASVWIWYTVIIDWDIWRENIDEFLDYIDDLENRILVLENKLKDFNY